MGIFDDEITDVSLEDLGFVPIGRNKWLYLFTSDFSMSESGDLKFAYDELIYYPKKKLVKTVHTKKKFKVDDLYELKLLIDSLNKSSITIDSEIGKLLKF